MATAACAALRVRPSTPAHRLVIVRLLWPRSEDRHDRRPHRFDTHARCLAPHALLPSGWARDVLLAWDDAGALDGVTPDAARASPASQRAPAASCRACPTCIRTRSSARSRA